MAFGSTERLHTKAGGHGTDYQGEWQRCSPLRRGMVCGRQFGVEYQTVGSDVKLVPSDTQHVQQKRGKGLVLGHLGHVREEREKQHANQWWLYHIIPNLRKCSSYSILQRWELSHR